MSLTRKTHDFNDERALHYVEFQTGIIKLAQVTAKRKMPAKKAFQVMLHTPSLFKAVDGHYQLNVLWQHRKGDREIVVNASSCALDFYYQGNLFLSALLNEKNELEIKIPDTPRDEWSENDINAIIFAFNDALRAQKISYAENKDKCIIPFQLSKNSNHHFDKDAFSNMMNCIPDHFSYRLNCVFNNARRRKNDFIFHLDWPMSKGFMHTLKVVFTRGDLFSRHFNEGELYSWLMSEESLLTYFPHYEKYKVSPGQFYYNLKVYEICKDSEKGKQEHEVLDVWTSEDAYVDELRTVHNGERISGNDVLDIYRYFDKYLFNTEYTFICDASKLFNQDKSIKIPLRLISALCTGQTWYQRKLPGLSLFECKNFLTIADRVITQDSFRRDKALADLQSLPLSEWSSMLDDEKLKIFQELCGRHLPSENHEFGKVFTLKDLVIKIYDDAKSKKCITSDLAALVKLLCEGTRVVKNSQKFKESDADFWLKSRVEELLGASRFWIRKRAQQEISGENKEVLQTRYLN